LKTLTPHEEKIIKMRFGLEDGSQHTLAEVGQTFALTRERIRQIEAKALCKLATPRARANSASSPPVARENNTRLPFRPKLEKGSRARGELGATFSESFSGSALKYRVCSDWSREVGFSEGAEVSHPIASITVVISRDVTGDSFSRWNERIHHGLLGVQHKQI